MGELYQWKGEWIDADISVEVRIAPIFRKVFEVKKKIANATIYICGLGLFELKVNGYLPDDSVLNPANTQYTQTVLYRVFDVTQYIKNNIDSKNTITVELGNGFFNENGGVWDWQRAPWREAPKLLLNLHLQYADKTEEWIVTDESWEVTLDGPTRANGIYQGETFDARRIARQMFAWKQAHITNAPKGKLKEQNMPPIRRIESFAPKRIQHMEDGTYLITVPEMIAGWAKIRFDAPFGNEIIISYNEQLNEKGYLQKLGKYEGENGEWWPDYYIQQDTFISSGEKFEFEPKFSYKGFQYIQIENYKGNLSKEDVTIYAIANDVEIISDFSCSNPLINQLHKLMRRTLLNNFQGKPTDTPVWEKNGWLGDANCGLTTMLYNFDMRTYLTSFVDTMADCFHEFGIVPIMVPTSGWGAYNSPVWNTFFVFAAEALYEYYGMKDYVKKLYPDLKAFAWKEIKAIEDNDWLWEKRGLSDWVAPLGKKDGPYVADPPEGAEICGSAFIYKMLKSMTYLARELGEEQDILEYEKVMEQIYTSFQEKFYRQEKGIYETNDWNDIGQRTKYRQTSNLVPLAFGLVPDAVKEKVVKNLVKDIIEKEYHLDTGCTGTKFILPVLCDNGYVDVAYKILTQTTYPSWGFWIQKGATSAWEMWESTARSRNHYFLGTYDEFFYTHLAGISEIHNQYETFTIRPAINCGLTYVNAYVKTLNGKIVCNWEILENGQKKVKIEVPQKAHAKICLNEKEWYVDAGKYEYLIQKKGEKNVYY